MRNDQQHRRAVRRVVALAAAVTVSLASVVVGTASGSVAGSVAAATTLSGPVLGLAGMCLDDLHSGTADGSRVDVYRCNGTAAQRWSVPGDGTVRVLGRCLDDSHSGTADGNRIQLWSCNGTAAQRWSLLADGTMRVLGRCLDVTHASTADGTPVQLWGCNTSPAQRWRPPGAVAPRTTRILTIVLENHSLAELQAGMPYLRSLAGSYGYATDYRAVAHPSLPNYLATAFGTTAGVTDDGPPSVHHVSGDSVFSLAQQAGTGARLYAESMPWACDKSDAYPYAVKHNPWAYGSTGCSSGDVPAGTPRAGALHANAAAGTLPCAGMLVPDLLHDAHDGSLAQADAYLKSWLPTVLSGPDFRSGRLAVVVTADEDDHSSSANRVLTVVIAPAVWHRVVTTTLTHYSLARMYGSVCHESRYLGNAGSAPSMVSAFGLSAG